MKLLLLAVLASLCVVAQGVPTTDPEVGDSGPVEVALFYETMCPECRNFITTQLKPTYDKLLRSGRN